MKLCPFFRVSLAACVALMTIHAVVMVLTDAKDDYSAFVVGEIALLGFGLSTQIVYDP